MSCVTRAFHGERVVRRPGSGWAGLDWTGWTDWLGWTGWAGLGARVFAAAPCVEMVRKRQTKQIRCAWLGERGGEAYSPVRPGCVADSSELADRQRGTILDRVS
jgi:hypothetical protein